jgi:thiamine biosynthesis lipoprotein
MKPSKLLKLCQVFCGGWMTLGALSVNSYREALGAPPYLDANHSTTEYLECGSRPEMGTPFKVCLVILASQQAEARADIQTAFLEIKAINDWMSDWIPGTELSQVNASAGRSPVKIRKELLELLKFSIDVARDSNGAFDPTFNVMWGAYNFKKGSEREATNEEIKSRLPLIDWRKLKLDSIRSTAFLETAGMKLGLGAVGQSYAADHLVGFFKSKGYRGGYVDGSGDTVFWGHKPGGALWTTGVRNPLWVDGQDKDHEVILRIYGTDFAITSCGDDEKYFIRDGRRVHHVIDPKTARPATLSRQVTVVARKGLDADAWDTAAFVMGAKKAIPLLERKGFRAVIVDADGKVHLTKGLKKTYGSWGEGYVVEGELK